MAKEKQQTILQLIDTDHREIEQIFDDIEEVDDADQLYELFNQLYKETNLHSQAEELVFYPALREYEDTEDIIEEAESEHEEAEVILEQMKALSPDSEEFVEKIGELREAIMHHLEEEEDEVFAIARDCMDDAQLIQLGQEFQSVKAKLEAEITEAAAR